MLFLREYQINDTRGRRPSPDAYPKNAVLVVDGASFHKRSDIRNAIEKAGHILGFLPAYSPHLNPIEQKWAQVKSIRKQKYYQIDELFKRGCPS